MTATPSPDAGNDEAKHLLLSRLADGDGTTACAEQASALWQADDASRARWHSYQLIGDVLRSQELAGAPARDADFLARLRTRIAQEPQQEAAAPAPAQVLALPMAAGARGWSRWLAPAAIAAGFVAVAGVLVVTRMSAPGAEPAVGAQLAQQTPAVGVQRAAVGAASQAASLEVLDAALVRDAQIDRYFRAHRDMRVSPAAALPGGALRSVDTMVPSR